MKLTGWVAVGLMCAWLVPAVPAVAPRATTQADSPFVLGVLRRDGVVLPFAAFDGRRWSEPWPADLRQDLPISLEDVPSRWWGRAAPPSALTQWLDGANSGPPVALTRPATIPIMCSSRIVLRSDYVSKQPVPLPFEQPFPKDGLVSSGSQRIDPIPQVARNSGEWKATPGVLLDRFNRLEDAAVGNFEAWRHPVTGSVRHRTPIEIEALYRLPMDEPGWAAYYVEAVRQYAPGPEDAGCGLVTFVSGWIRLPGTGTPLFDLDAVVSYCDRRGAGYLLPLGTMRLDDRQFWIYQLSGQDREWYVVARPARRSIEIHVEYPAGTCPTSGPQ
ncbi:hypothetical protein BH23ACI1_BH23ACI1_24410 [soil metagenome]